MWRHNVCVEGGAPFVELETADANGVTRSLAVRLSPAAFIWRWMCATSFAGHSIDNTNSSNYAKIDWESLIFLLHFCVGICCLPPVGNSCKLVLRHTVNLCQLCYRYLDRYNRFYRTIKGSTFSYWGYKVILMHFFGSLSRWGNRLWVK